jgi:intracellular septation protein
MAGTKKINPIVKLVLEMGPIVLFFIGYVRMKDASFTILGGTYSGFIVMTALFIPLMLVTTGILWALTGKLSKMQIATVVLVVIFGGLSVWLNDERFFKMKPTMIYLLFAGVLSFGLLRGKIWLALVMEEVLPMRPEGWVILTRRLIGFFFALAVANEVIWRTMSDQTWVNFKTFGLTALMMVFFFSQAKLFEKYALPDEEKAPEEPEA